MHRNPSAIRVDGFHDSAEMDRDTMPTALRYEILDQRAIALRDASMPTLPSIYSSRIAKVLVRWGSAAS